MTVELKRIQREKDTVQKMVSIYCRGKHKSERELCVECSGLIHYSTGRLDNCKLGANKPVCGRCKIHCYKSEMRMKIKSVMKYSGPIMLFTHPIMTLYHFRQMFRR